MVIVNTVVIVKARFGLGEAEVTGFGGVWGRLDDRCICTAWAAQQISGSTCHGHGSGGAGYRYGHRGADSVLCSVASTLAGDWFRLQRGTNAFWSAAAPFRPCRGSACAIRCTVCAVTCLLADLLPAGGTLRCCLWTAINLHRYVIDWPCRCSACANALACRRSIGYRP